MVYPGGSELVECSYHVLRSDSSGVAEFIQPCGCEGMFAIGWYRVAAILLSQMRRANTLAADGKWSLHSMS